MAARLLDQGRSAIATEMIGALLGRAPSMRAQARLRSMVEGTRYETFIASLEGMKDRPDRSSLLPRIAVPALVVAGDQDALITVEDSRAMANSIPGARMAVVTDAGHLHRSNNPIRSTRTSSNCSKAARWCGGRSAHDPARPDFAAWRRRTDAGPASSPCWGPSPSGAVRAAVIGPWPSPAARRRRLLLRRLRSSSGGGRPGPRRRRPG